MPSRRSELLAPPCFKPYAASTVASSFPLVGDYIGMESYVDIEERPNPGASTGGGDFARAEPERDRRWRWEPKGKGKRRGEREEKEHPPPIPLLARTGNLHPHMPWVLRRHYTSDGRLILAVEKVRHHEYFRALRANGRLTLQLVPLDGDAPCFQTIADEDEEQEEEEEETLNPDAGITTANDLENRGDEDDFQDDIGDCIGEEEEEEDCAKLASSIAELTLESGGGMGGNGTGKCSNYNGISVSPSSPCIFGVPVPALSPVHS